MNIKPCFGVGNVNFRGAKLRVLCDKVSVVKLKFPATQNTTGIETKLIVNLTALSLINRLQMKENVSVAVVLNFVNWKVIQATEVHQELEF